MQTGCGDGPCPRVLVVNVDYAQAQELQERVGIDSRIDLRLLDAENARFAGLRILRCAQRPSRRTRTERLRTLPGMYCFPILWDSTPFALPLLLLLASVSVSIRWVNSLSRLVGVASGGFSRGWRHGRIGHQSYVASIDDAKLGSGCDEFCV